MNLFLDANILVSVLNKEYPAFTHTSRVLSLADDPRFNIFTSPVCLAIAFYFAEKKSGTVLAKKKMSILIEKLEIAECSKEGLKQAAANKAIRDLEDGIEYYAALHASCNCIVTEDKKDFHFSEIEVLNAAGFLEKYVRISRV